MTVLALLIAAAASATPAVITQPDWLQKPGGEQVGHAYPKLAQELFLEGRATIGCKVSTTGRLDDCRVLDELPKGLGFGRGALELGQAFQMRPMTRNGQPVAGGVVRIPILFRLPYEPPPPQPQRTPTSPAALDLARKLIDESHFSDGPIHSLDASADKLDFLENEELSDEVRTQAAVALRAAARANTAEMEAEATRLYASEFTAAELEGLLAFRATPTGAQVMKSDDDTRAMDIVINREGQRRTVEAARAAFCAAHDCRDPGPGPAAEVAWAETPSADTVEEFRTEAAKALRLGGTVRLTCTANAQGFLADCKVASEAPKGLGLGPAAVALRAYYRLAPAAIPADPSAKPVPVTVHFDTPNPDDPAEIPKPRSARAMQLARAYLAVQHHAEKLRAAWQGRVQKGLEHPQSVLPPADLASVIDAMSKGLDRTLPGLEDVDAAYLTHRLSDEALIEGARFWRSPAGQAWLAKWPKLDVETATIAGRYRRRVLEDTGVRLCAAIGCAPEGPASRPQPTTAVNPEPSTRKP